MNASAPIPGAWICPKCGFLQSYRILALSAGVIAVDETLKRKLCPNDGTLMAQRTERDALETMDANVEALLNEVDAGGGRWVPVERELPEIGVRVLVACGPQGQDIAFGEYRTWPTQDGVGTFSGWLSSRNIGPVVDDVTHWRRLPSLPNTD